MILWQRSGVAHRTINYPCFDDRCVQERYSRISVPFTEYAVDIPNQERRRARLGGNPGRIVRTETWCEMRDETLIFHINQVIAALDELIAYVK